MSEKPLSPAPAECCESGCEPCVWDVYFEELRKWKEEQSPLLKAVKNHQATVEEEDIPLSDEEVDNRK